ncbi:MAG: TVP38/TMEM64 family protein [Proteobacteria bacterium]|nr:TVP38/TMEM64 family protein [Pseudomonadota bacterium]
MFSHRFKLLFASLWAILFVFIVALWYRSGIELTSIPNVLHDHLSEFGHLKAALTYIILYTIRPLILFPATLLTIASGLIFGPWLGILFTIIGENASANLAFTLARWLGRDWISSHEHGTVLRWEEKIRGNTIGTVLVMRLIYLPFDAVNYGCGLTSMRHVDYFIGTFLGIIPGLLSFVLLGGTAAASVTNRLLIFGMAVFFFIFGLIIARLLHKMKPHANKNEEGL